MSQAFGDERLEQRLRLVLDERAEAVASQARTAEEIAADLIPRLRAGRRSSARLEAFGRIVAIAAVLALLLAILALGIGRPHSPIDLRIAVDLPFVEETGMQSVVDAVRLAIAREGAAGGPTLALTADGVFNDAGPSGADPDLGAANLRTIVADARYIAVIGPYTSGIAKAEIPITNAAGLLQCSPSNTDPDLTIGDAATALRPQPERRSYVRVAATDAAQADGAARFMVGHLGARTLFVLAEDGFAGGRSDRVVEAFERLGGTVVGTKVVSSDGVIPALVAAEVLASRPDAVFFDGRGELGGTLLRALVSSAADLPLVALDGIVDGPSSASGTFLNAAGASRENAYAIIPASFDRVRGLEVEAAHIAAYGARPVRHAFGGYACAEVILAALARMDLPPWADLAGWREALRAEVTEPGRRYQTVLGDFAFDANGDPTPVRVSVFHADDALGDWAFSEVVDIAGG
jgi:branched-chain amino acid transport system substrate-binding protein